MAVIVTIGTDGVTDWVKTPDGLKYNLGPVSALRFVAGLIPRGRAKRVLDTFLSAGEALASVDEDRMWALLAPHRARWSSNVSSSMPPEECKPAHARKGTMTTLSEDLTKIENHIQLLNKAAAAKAVNLAEGVGILVKLANKIKSPNQSKNQTYYNLGAPQVHEVGDKVAGEGVEGLSYDTYSANVDLAATITAKAEETVKTIDKLAKAGRSFNASRAKSDVAAVTTKVAGILSADLTASWVRGDLDKLAARMDQIHGLFAKAKV
jgi:hypothetical protein